MKPRLAIFIQTTLASSIAMMFAPAFAQQTAPTPAAAASAPGAAASAPAAGATNLNSVTVTGYRASIQRAMEVKRNANAIVDAISAEDIGKFPDTNAAESLSHLPGISVDRLYGEGEKVSINGTDPALNRVLVNGQTIASGQWGGDPSDRTGRTFNYTLLSPEIIGLMEVYKSPEARIDEGSIGGTVIIHTRKPLELPANTLRGSIGYEYNDRSKLGDPRASFLYSWKDESNRFGFLATVTHDKKRLSQGGIEFFGYGKGDSINPNATVNGSGNLATSRLPVAIDTDNFQQTRQRDGFQGAAQWKIDEHNEVNLTGIYVRGKFDNYSLARYVLPISDQANFTNVSVNNGLITGGTIVPSAGQAGTAELDTNIRLSTVTTKSLNLTHDLTFDGWKLKSTAGYTEATGGRDPEYLMKFLLLSGGYSFSYGPKQAGVVYTNPSANNWGLPASPAGRPPGDPTLPGANQAGGIDTSINRDNERYGQLDFSHDLDWGPVKEVLVGVKYLKHENGNTAFGNRINTTDAVNLSQFGGATVDGGVYNGLNVSGDIVNGWPSANRDAVIAYLNGQPQGPFNRNLDETFTVREYTKNLYTQFNYELGSFRGNFGLRYVNTRDSSFYYLATDNNGTNFAPTTSDKSYSKLLPSFNLVYDLDSTKVLRFSAAKVLARPRYSDMAATTVRNNTQIGNPTISGGNPELKPYESTNFDAAAEWYFSPRSMVGAELFYRDVKNYIVNITTMQDLPNPANGGQIESYAVSRPTNGSYAKVKGISLLYNQDIGYGFGIQSNYTWAIADAQQGLNLPYLSRNTVNLTPYFESGPYSVRVTYGYRSDYFTAVGRLNSQDFTSSYRDLSLAASYEISKQISVTATASNLLDSTYYQYSGVPDAPTGFYKNGRMFQVGLSFKL